MLAFHLFDSFLFKFHSISSLTPMKIRLRNVNNITMHQISAIKKKSLSTGLSSHKHEHQTVSNWLPKMVVMTTMIAIIIMIIVKIGAIIIISVAMMVMIIGIRIVIILMIEIEIIMTMKYL